MISPSKLDLAVWLVLQTAAFALVAFGIYALWRFVRAYERRAAQRQEPGP